MQCLRRTNSGIRANAHAVAGGGVRRFRFGRHAGTYVAKFAEARGKRTIIVRNCHSVAPVRIDGPVAGPLPAVAECGKHAGQRTLAGFELGQALGHFRRGYAERRSQPFERASANQGKPGQVGLVQVQLHDGRVLSSAHEVVP